MRKLSDYAVWLPGRKTFQVRRGECWGGGNSGILGLVRQRRNEMAGEQGVGWDVATGSRRREIFAVAGLRGKR